MQLPPPVHGVSVMNSLIRHSALINSAFRCDYVNLTTARNIDDLQKSGLYKYFRTLKILFLSVYKMMTNRYRYVYVTVFPFGFAFYKDSLVVLLARLFRLKPLLHLHTHGFKKAASHSGWRKWYYQFVFRNSEVICLSDRLLEDVEGIYKGKVYILPNGIPQVNYKNTYKNNQSPVTLLYLSNLIKGKGILVLMDAIDILKRKGSSFHLRVVGPEGDITYEMLRKIISEKHLQKEVSLIGPSFGEEKYEEFRQAGIFLLPSNYDTFGLVLLEAMQFGVPCISTNIGGIPDVLGEGRGMIISEIVPLALAEAIDKLLTHPAERSKISETAFNYFSANFTVGVFEQRLINILSGNADRINERLDT